MRHKAAIGVSEVSDAVVVVVSEETSKISIAYNGILDSDIPKSEFKDKLSMYLKK
jgi:diadenylate cyclase